MPSLSIPNSKICTFSYFNISIIWCWIGRFNSHTAKTGEHHGSRYYGSHTTDPFIALAMTFGNFRNYGIAMFRFIPNDFVNMIHDIPSLSMNSGSRIGS